MSKEKKMIHRYKFLIVLAITVSCAACKLGDDFDKLGDDLDTVMGTVRGYTVAFNANGGSGVPAQTLQSGKTAKRPDNPTLGGYAFDNWYTDTDLTSPYNFDDPVTKNITLYAKWSEYCTITFNTNGATGGEPLPAQTVVVGASITLPGGYSLSRTGYSFGGWNTQDDGRGNSYNGYSSFTPEGSITLYARWVSTITYNANGALGYLSRYQDTVYAGSSITIPGSGSLSKSGYTFSGWNTNAEGTGTNYKVGDTYTPTGSITLYARWSLPFIVTFDTNGATSGTVPAAQTVNYGTAIKLPGGVSKTGYDLIGWNTNALGTGTNYNVNSSFTPEGDITLYANWRMAYNAVFFTGLSANGSETESTTTLTLTFDRAINISAGDITLSGVSGITKGTLSGIGPSYTLPISGFIASGTLTVAVASANYTFIDSPRTTTVYFNTAAAPGNTLTAQLSWLNSNAKSNTNYTLELNANEALADQTLSYSGRSNVVIILKGTGSERTVTGSFTVNSGVKLVLDEYITLKGGVVVNENGALIMEDNSKITGNTGSGVRVNYNGIFTMNGGEISGNTFSVVQGYDGGGGVYTRGTFIMNGGRIAHNTVNILSGYQNKGGGGVYVAQGGFFTMYSGEIMGNTVTGSIVYSSGGGGVHVDRMVGSYGTFRIVTGTIYGLGELEDFSNTAPEGAAYYSNYDSAASYGTFSGNTWNAKGNLTTKELTIRVVNGVLQ